LRLYTACRSEIKKGLEGIRERSAAASERWQARLY
jgi:hypothetical protein